MSNYVYGRGQYRDYLQAKSFADDATGISLKIHYQVSKQTREIVATNDQLKRLNITTEGIRDEISYLGSSIDIGFERLSLGLDRISGEISELSATFEWGFSGLIEGVDRINSSLQELVDLKRKGIQTWAYNLHENALNAIRQQLYPEALKYLDQAIKGVGSNVGYELEHQFHFRKGLIYLGNVENHDPSIVNLSLAEAAFLAAARYAKKDYPHKAAQAWLAAGWAAYCQGKMTEAISHSKQAIALHAELGEAYFQVAKVLMHVDDPTNALIDLEKAIVLDPRYSLKALADGDFDRHNRLRDDLLTRLRAQARLRASNKIEKANEQIQQLLDWHAHESDPSLFHELSTALKNARSAYATNTYMGFLEAERYLKEAITKGAKAVQDIPLNVRARAGKSLNSARQSRDSIAQAALECASTALAEADEALDFAAQQMTTGANFNDCAADMKRVTMAADLVASAGCLVSAHNQRMETDRRNRIKEVEDWNAGVDKLCDGATNNGGCVIIWLLLIPWYFSFFIGVPNMILGKIDQGLGVFGGFVGFILGIVVLCNIRKILKR
jgi:tetratricopeptide (TPR) repeat protein